MWILSQTSDVMMDFTAIELTGIMENNQQTGQPEQVGWQLIAHSFGTAFVIARYGDEVFAKRIFLDIAGNLKKGTEFYDLREKEQGLRR